MITVAGLLWRHLGLCSLGGLTGEVFASGPRMARVIQLVGGNPLQLMFVICCYIVAENAYVESRMHGQAVTVTGEVLQGVTDAAGQANVAT